MSQPFPEQQTSEPAPSSPKNGLGTAGFVLGLIGLLFSFIPIIGVVAWPLVILGLIFGAIGFARSRKRTATNGGLAIAGAILSLIGLVICIVWTAGTAKVANDISNEANRQATIHYEVTGDAKDTTVTYSTFGDGGSSTSQEQPKTLPWSKDITVKGLGKGGTLTVTTGMDGGSVTCKVVVDGKESKTSTAQGTMATASCDGF